MKGNSMMHFCYEISSKVRLYSIDSLLNCPNCGVQYEETEAGFRRTKEGKAVQ